MKTTIYHSTDTRIQFVQSNRKSFTAGPKHLLKLIFLIFFFTAAYPAFSQNPLPGIFYDFDQNAEAKSGLLPFFRGIEDFEGHTVTAFYPSSIKRYIDLDNQVIRYGVDLRVDRPPVAKFEVFVPEGATALDFPAFKGYGGNIGLDASGSHYGVKAYGLTGVYAEGHTGIRVRGEDNGYGIFEEGGDFCFNYLKSKNHRPLRRYHTRYPLL